VHLFDPPAFQTQNGDEISNVPGLAAMIDQSEIHIPGILSETGVNQQVIHRFRDSIIRKQIKQKDEHFEIKPSFDST
jgi:hypothetical protein